LWGAEERSGRGGARSALRQHSHRTCPNEAPAGRVVSCAMRPCCEHRRAVCASSARPPHHEPPPAPACRDARRRQRKPQQHRPQGQVLFCNIAMQDLTPAPTPAGSSLPRRAPTSTQTAAKNHGRSRQANDRKRPKPAGGKIPVGPNLQPSRNTVWALK
jgi:hypothetical protein